MAYWPPAFAILPDGEVSGQDNCEVAHGPGLLPIGGKRFGKIGQSVGRKDDV
jgi:hypothetical protein